VTARNGGERDDAPEATCSSDPSRPWPDAEERIRRVPDGPIREALFEVLTRQREGMAVLVRTVEANETNARHFGLTVASLEGVHGELKRAAIRADRVEGKVDDLAANVDLLMALTQGTAAEVGVSKSLIEQHHEDVRRLKARAARRDADEAQLRAGVTEARADARQARTTADDTSKTAALSAAVAHEKAASAALDAAKAETRLEVVREALRSHHDDDRAEDAARAARRAAKQARRWQIFAGVLLAVIGAGISLGAWYVQNHAAPSAAPAIGGK
jgi:hypothetical protein